MGFYPWELKAWLRKRIIKWSFLILILLWICCKIYFLTRYQVVSTIFTWTRKLNDHGQNLSRMEVKQGGYQCFDQASLNFYYFFFVHLLAVSSAPADYFRSASRMSTDSEHEGPVPGKLRAGSMLHKAEVNTALWGMHDHVIWSHGWIWLWKFWTKEFTMREWLDNPQFD